MSRVFSHKLLDYSYDTQFRRVCRRYGVETLLEALECKAHTMTGESSVCIAALISRGAYTDFASTLSEHLSNPTTRHQIEKCRRAYALIRRYFTHAEIPELNMIYKRLVEHDKSVQNPKPILPESTT